MTIEEKIYNLLKSMVVCINNKREFTSTFLPYYKIKSFKNKDYRSSQDYYQLNLYYNNVCIISLNMSPDNEYYVNVLVHHSQFINSDITDMDYFEYILNYDKITHIMSGILYQTILDYDVIHNSIKNYIVEGESK